MPLCLSDGRCLLQYLSLPYYWIVMTHTLTGTIPAEHDIVWPLSFLHFSISEVAVRAPSASSATGLFCVLFVPPAVSGQKTALLEGEEKPEL